MRLRKKIRVLPQIIMLVAILMVNGLGVSASELSLDERVLLQQEMPIDTNEIEGWPEGPVVSAESAILIEAETGTILYAKNIHLKEYPASTTKILTTLMATELLDMDEEITFSHDAIFDNPAGASGIAMDVGQTMTVEQCIQAVLIRSANECAFGLAELMSGTTDWTVFGQMMNERAAELGALNSNFINPNGLPDENHYTTAYDLAMIGRAFFDNEWLCKTSITSRMEIPANETHEAKVEMNAMQIIPGGKYGYSYLIGCKTGYTVDARSCLVSAAVKDGMKLICVVMRDEAPMQYEDTISLYNYGFSNFTTINISDNETKYQIANTGFTYVGMDSFGSTTSLLTLGTEDFIVLPKTASLADCETTITFTPESDIQAAEIAYTYHGVSIGAARLLFTASDMDKNEFDAVDEETGKPVDETSEEHQGTFFINIYVLLGALGAIVVVILVILCENAFFKNYQLPTGGHYKNTRRNWKKRNRRRSRGRRGRGSGPFRDIDF